MKKWKSYIKISWEIFKKQFLHSRSISISFTILLNIIINIQVKSNNNIANIEYMGDSNVLKDNFKDIDTEKVKYNPNKT